MRAFRTCLTHSLLVVFLAGVTFSDAHAQAYEVWACDGFNAQGYDDVSTIQFYPFNHKIGDLLKFDLSDTSVLAINRGVNGNFYSYVLTRIDGAPVYWLSFDSSFNLLNSSQMIASCSYSN